jgi:hypothetical protein
VIRRCLLLAFGASAPLLAGCEHAENYRWSFTQSPPPSPSVVSPPSVSEFEWEGPSVSVYTFPTAKPAGFSVSIKDLSDRAQAELIKAKNNPGPGADGLPGAFAKSLGVKTPDVEGAATVDESYDQTLVATVTKGLNAGIGERLVSTWIDVRPVNFLFDGYTVVATDNETLDIVDITNKTTASAQAQMGAPTKSSKTTTSEPADSTGATVSNETTRAPALGAGLTGSLSQEYTTAASINQQYVKLSADITPRELRIYRESERNLDVAGNTLIALTMKVDPDLWRQPAREVSVIRVAGLTLSQDGALLDPDKITFEAGLERSPPHCDLVADVRMYYLVRRPRNARSYVEGQQEADYVRGVSGPRRVHIVPASTVRPPSWRIYGAGDPNRTMPVTLGSVFGVTLPLDFSTYEQARDFAVWMSQKTAKLVGAKLGKSGAAFTAANLPPGPFHADRFVDPARAAACDGMTLSADAPPIPTRVRPQLLPGSPAPPAR